MTTIETTALRDRMAGQVVTPDDAGYDEARALYNGMIDRRPAVIARCRSRGRRPRRARLRAAGRADDRRARRRAQRARVRHRRGRPGDRPVGYARGGRRPGGAHRPGAGRRHVGRRRRRDARARAGAAVRDLLHHRRRRADAGRRARLPVAQVRADHRQPARGRGRADRRAGRDRVADRASRPVLGAARWRGQLRRRDVVRVPAATRSAT